MISYQSLLLSTTVLNDNFKENIDVFLNGILHTSNVDIYNVAS